MKKKLHHHPYPLFQSDDPNVDDNIVLLDNDQGTKETGVYTLNDYDDYAEYDYKGNNGSYFFPAFLSYKDSMNITFTTVLSRHNRIHFSLREAKMTFSSQAAKRRG